MGLIRPPHGADKPPTQDLKPTPPILNPTYNSLNPIYILRTIMLLEADLIVVLDPRSPSS
jgi:hypothetical protein